MLPSLKNNLERRARLRRREHAISRRGSLRRCACASESPIPHPLFLVEKPGSNTRARRLARNARAVVGDANRARVRPAVAPSTDECARHGRRARRSRSSSAPRSPTRAARGRRCTTGRSARSSRRRSRSCWRASARAPKVRRDAIDERRRRRSARTSARDRCARSDAPRDRAARDRRACAPRPPRDGRPRAFLQQLDPSSETRERRPELMRRLARHARPQSFARGVAARANDVEAGEEQDGRGQRLQHRNDAQPCARRRVAVVDLAR